MHVLFFLVELVIRPLLIYSCSVLRVCGPFPLLPSSARILLPLPSLVKLILHQANTPWGGEFTKHWSPLTEGCCHPIEWVVVVRVLWNALLCQWRSSVSNELVRYATSNTSITVLKSRSECLAEANTVHTLWLSCLKGLPDHSSFYCKCEYL